MWVTFGKHLNYSIFSLKGDAWAHRTSIPPHHTEMYMCIKGIEFASLYDSAIVCLNVPTVWHFLVFHLNDLNINIHNRQIQAVHLRMHHEVVYVFSFPKCPYGIAWQQYIFQGICYDSLCQISKTFPRYVNDTIWIIASCKLRRTENTKVKMKRTNNDTSP